jgi:hypothetical protein
MSYLDETWKPHLRITILRLLEAQAGYSANCSILRDGAEAVGLTASRDQVRGEIAWLAEQGLVTMRAVENLTIAKSTERGLDVAAGRARVPGVKPPSP